MAPDAGHTDPRPVLVVEDSDDDFDTVRLAAALAKVSNRLVRAVGSDAAMQLLAEHPPGTFAFMLLDYNLPGADGLALLRHLRGTGLLGQLPTVVLTTSVDPRDRLAFGAAGASAFHVKSVRHAEGLRVLGAIFDAWLNRAPLPMAAAVSAPTGEPA